MGGGRECAQYFEEREGESRPTSGIETDRDAFEERKDRHEDSSVRDSSEFFFTLCDREKDDLGGST